MLEQGTHSLTGVCTVLILRKFLDILISFYLYCYWLGKKYRLLQKIFNTWKHKSENEINLKIGNMICCSDCPMASLLKLHQERGSVWGVSREWPSQWGDASFEIELFLSVLISCFCASFLLTTFFFFFKSLEGWKKHVLWAEKNEFTSFSPISQMFYTLVMLVSEFKWNNWLLELRVTTSTLFLY